MKKIIVSIFLTAILFSCKKISQQEEEPATNSESVSGSSNRTSATPPIIQWQKCFGSTGTDDGYSIAAAKDPVTGISTGYFLVGTTNGNNGNVSGNHGGNDAWLVKTDLAGNLQWQLAIGGTGNDNGKGVVATDDGGCLVAIDAHSSDGDFSTLGGKTGFVLVKVSSTGSILWKQQYGTGTVQALISTLDGVAITGWDQGPQAVDPQESVWLLTLKPDPQATQNHPYIINIQNTFGIPTGTHGETGYGITQTQTGFAIVGVTYSVVNGSTDPDIYVVNTDAVGGQLWAKTLGDANSSDVGFGITSSFSDGGVVITGYIGLNLVVAKLYASGTIGWQTTYVGGRGQAIISANDGYVATGSTGARKGDLITTNGGEDMILLKLDLAGNKKTSYSFGGTAYERGRGIIPSADGNGYTVIGYTNSNNGSVSGNHGGNDFWMVKLNN